MSRFIWGGFRESGVNLLAAPRSESPPDTWRDETLASVRGEINYKLMEPRLGDYVRGKLEKLRSDIEAEMRKRLNTPESPEEFARRKLFHASQIDYKTGDGRR